MKVWELKSILNKLDDDMEIVVQAFNSNYADTPTDIELNKGIRSYWANDYKAAIIVCGEQVGAIWDLDDLDIDEEEEE